MGEREDGEFRVSAWKERAERFSEWFRRVLADRRMKQTDVARKLYEQDEPVSFISYRTRVNDWYHGPGTPVP